MKILVCGGRDFRDEDFVYGVLDSLFVELGFDLLIHGAAAGADTVAASWAAGHPHVHSVAVPANWHMRGRAAGPIRNSFMLKLEPDLVVAFPGGKGTRNMVLQSEKAGIEVRKYAREDSSSAFYSRCGPPPQVGGGTGVGGDEGSTDR